MEGLIAEGKEHMEEELGPSVMDAALIASAQKVEHYDIAAYGSARTLAEEVGQPRVAELLQATLDGDSASRVSFRSVAEDLVNQQTA